MAAINDLMDAVSAMSTSMTNLQAAVVTENEAIDKALAVITNPNSNEQQIADAAAAIKTASQNIDTLTSGAAQETAAITAALPVVPTP